MTEKLPCCESHDASPAGKPVVVKKIVIGFLAFVVIAVGWWLYRTSPVQPDRPILPVASGIVLPITWGDIGKQMVETGVIDAPKMTGMYQGRGGVEEVRWLLATDVTGPVIMTAENAPLLLNMLWAFGLSNQNAVLDSGPMAQYSQPGNLASTAGWTLSVGDPMDHYSRHAFASLTAGQQEAVERVAKGIYRPCCGNSTHFPDCNHGMAMLGLLELMAARGVSEDEMYKIALKVNTYWFPDIYQTIAQYLQETGRPWETVSPQELLGEKFSSGSGASQIATAYQRLIAEKEAAIRRESAPAIPEARSSGGCSV